MDRKLERMFRARIKSGTLVRPKVCEHCGVVSYKPLSMYTFDEDDNHVFYFIHKGCYKKIKSGVEELDPITKAKAIFRAKSQRKDRSNNKATGPQDLVKSFRAKVHHMIRRGDVVKPDRCEKCGTKSKLTVVPLNVSDPQYSKVFLFWCPDCVERLTNRWQPWQPYMFSPDDIMKMLTRKVL